MTDLAVVAARFGAALHDAGVAVGADRCERFARAVQLVRPQRTSELYRCAAVTLLADPDDRPAFDRVVRAGVRRLRRRGDVPRAGRRPGRSTSRRRARPRGPEHREAAGRRRRPPVRHRAADRPGDPHAVPPDRDRERAAGRARLRDAGARRARRAGDGDAPAAPGQPAAAHAAHRRRAARAGGRPARDAAPGAPDRRLPAAAAPAPAAVEAPAAGRPARHLRLDGAVRAGADPAALLRGRRAARGGVHLRHPPHPPHPCAAGGCRRPSRWSGPGGPRRTGRAAPGSAPPSRSSSTGTAPGAWPAARWC